MRRRWRWCVRLKCSGHDCNNYFVTFAAIIKLMESHNWSWMRHLLCIRKSNLLLMSHSLISHYVCAMFGSALTIWLRNIYFWMHKRWHKFRIQWCGAESIVDTCRWRVRSMIGIICTRTRPFSHEVLDYVSVFFFLHRNERRVKMPWTKVNFWMRAFAFFIFLCRCVHFIFILFSLMSFIKNLIPLSNQKASELLLWNWHAIPILCIKNIF